MKKLSKHTLVATAVCLFVSVILSGCSSKNEDTIDNKIENAASDSLSVVEIYSYSGKFIEDGSDEEVNDIIAAVLVNNTSTDYEYVEFTVTTDKATHKFSASTVKAGSVVTSLCKTKDKFEKNESMQSFDIGVKAEFSSPISFAEGVLETYNSDKTVSVKNVSGTALSNICVYYKKKDDIGYFGGITFKRTISSLNSGEISQFYSDHLDEIVNITYDR